MGQADLQTILQFLPWLICSRACVNAAAGRKGANSIEPLALVGMARWSRSASSSPRGVIGIARCGIPDLTRSTIWAALIPRDLRKLCVFDVDGYAFSDRVSGIFGGDCNAGHRVHPIIVAVLAAARGSARLDFFRGLRRRRRDASPAPEFPPHAPNSRGRVRDGSRSFLFSADVAAFCINAVNIDLRKRPEETTT
jgi:hypothetical protein